jgi:hypothetical protein
MRSTWARERTPLGRWSIGLLLGAIVLLIANVHLVVAAGQRGPGFNLWLAFTIILAGVAAALGGVTAAVAVLRFRERGARVFAAEFLQRSDCAC